MPLLGEQAWHGWAYTTGDDPHSHSWEFNWQPSPKYFKVSLGSYYEFDDKSSVNVGLIKIRWRDSNGVDQTINFPDINDLDPVLVQYHSSMTHVTFGIRVTSAYGLLVWTLGYW